MYAGKFSSLHAYKGRGIEPIIEGNERATTQERPAKIFHQHDKVGKSFNNLWGTQGVAEVIVILSRYVPRTF